MVVKLNKIILIYFIAFYSNRVFSQDNNHNSWKNVFLEAYSNLPEVQKIINNKKQAEILYLQSKFQYLPKFSIDLPQRFSISPGDFFYTNGLSVSPKLASIISPTLETKIYQKLPGNGIFQITSRYSFNFLSETRSYLQNPSLTLSLSQSLGYGFLGIRDPDIKLRKVQLDYNTTYYEKQLFEQIINIVKKIKDFDTQNVDRKYNELLLRLYEVKSLTTINKQQLGVQSELESFYAKQELMNLKHKITILNYDTNEISSEINLLMPSLTEDFVEKKRSSLMKFLSTNFKFDSESINERLYQNLIFQQELEYQKNEQNHVPLLYSSASLSPDSDLYFKFSNWNKSWEELFSFPHPLIYTFTLGIKIEFETNKEKKFRKELLQKTTESIYKELKTIQIREVNEKKLLIEQIQQLNEYLRNLEKDIYEENIFCNERKKLFDENIITEELFLEGEISYAYILKTYISTFWILLEKQLELYKLTNGYEEIINKILGEEL